MFEAADDGISSLAMLPRHTQPSSVIASVKLPDFRLSDPAPWFQHVEALFHLRGVTEDDSKYYLVVAALDQQSTRRVMQLLRDPPPCGKYAAIKGLLLRRFGLSAAERADKLLSLPGLGDGSAVDLMDSMLSLLGSDEGGFLFPHIFLRQLPHPVRAALANSPSLAAGDFRGLAEEADRVLLTARRTSVQSVLADPQLLVSEDPDQVMVAGVSSRKKKSDLCFFHQRFGHKARRCVPPCAFQTQGNARARTQ
ncbi:unnamed protein product [Tetraodon nigroviridis]|uniref:(spotted green pufferfish) hypothetical protein n=1 Tax=Tetraodon nigroviridis TaxID=99883 RepID=Q4SRF5_TETNG|nr:unnamed protein product [Tetraodon nigroviridis]